MLEFLFNKVTDLKAWNFIKKRLQHRCFPVKSEKFLRTPFWRTSANDCFYTINVKKFSNLNVFFLLWNAYFHSCTCKWQLQQSREITQPSDFFCNVILSIFALTWMFCVCKSRLDTSFRSNDKHLLLKLLNSSAYEK